MRFSNPKPWYKKALNELSNNRSVIVINRGRSMEGLIADGQSVVVEPYFTGILSINDIVFVRLGRNKFLMHLIREIDQDRYLIGNNRGGTDGWVNRDSICGLVKTEFDMITEADQLVTVDEGDAY